MKSIVVSIILAIVTALLIVVVPSDRRDDDRRDRDRRDDDRHDENENGASKWLYAIGIGLATGIFCYVVPVLVGLWQWLSLVALIFMVGCCVFVVYLWRCVSSDSVKMLVRGFIACLLLECGFFYLMAAKVSPAVGTMLCRENVFWQSVCLTLPKLVFTLAIGLILASFFCCMRDQLDYDGDDYDDYDYDGDDYDDYDYDDYDYDGDDYDDYLLWPMILNGLGWVTYAATAVIVLTLLITGVQWRSLDWSLDVKDAVANSMSEPAQEEGAANAQQLEEPTENEGTQQSQQTQAATQTSSGRAEARRAEKQKKTTKATEGESEALKAEDEPMVSKEEVEAFEAAIKEAEDDLSVDPTALEDLAIERYAGVSWKLSFNSLSATDRTRVKATGFSDALTFGVEAEDEEGIRDEIAEEILRNPVVGVTFVKALSTKTIDGARSIGDWNPWMSEMIDKADRQGLIAWCEQRNGTTWYVTWEYRAYATAICAFLDRCIYQGVQEWQTSENWCLATALTDNWRVGEVASYQHSRPSHIFAWSAKNGLELFVFGIDCLDKRPEFYGGTPEQPEPFRPGQNPRPTLTPPPEEPPPEEPPQEEKKDPTDRPEEAVKNNIQDLSEDPETIDPENLEGSTGEQLQNSGLIDTFEEYQNQIFVRREEGKDEPEEGGLSYFTPTLDPSPEVDNSPDHGNGEAVFGDDTEKSR